MRLSTQSLTFAAYESGQYFAPLDGLRAVAVLMVVVHHMTEKKTWYWLNGFNGVAIFFVISGFLITTLCIREQNRNDGRLSLRNFYIKRIFRIVPLYFLALAGYGVMTGVWGITGTWAQYVERLPYYLSFNGELVKDQLPFAISWSLGVEEKFYVVWPLLLIASRALSRTALVLSSVALVAIDYAAGRAFAYPAMYFGIVVGCALAFALNHPFFYHLLRRCMSVPAASNGILAMLIVTCASSPHFDGSLPSWPLAATLAQLLVPASAALIALLVIRPSSALSRFLASAPALWVGKRSYAIYLFHAMVIHVVDTFIAPNQGTLTSVGRLMTVLTITFVVADVVHRFVEAPLRNYGRRLAHGRLGAGVPIGVPVR